MKRLEENTCYAEVLPLVGVNTPFIYRLPSHLKLAVGSLVKIKLKGRECLGLIKSLNWNYEKGNLRISDVLSALYDFPVLTEELIKLGEWMRCYYGLTYASTFESFLPGMVRNGKTLKPAYFLRLVVRLSESDLTAWVKKAPRQATLYHWLSANRNGVESYEKFVKQFPASTDVLKVLIKKGIVEKFSEDGNDSFAAKPSISISPKSIVLSDVQKKVATEIGLHLERGGYTAHLLLGVTGSGKTEIYHHLIRKLCNETNKSALYLVPEIALTEQAIEKIYQRFGEEGIRAVVWHSRLTENERLAIWRQIVTGFVRVVIGTRSAIFMPLKRLGLVIVDEEHEAAYKQAESPRYQGRDLAVYRAFLNQATCVLGSATPSLESWHNVKKGKYFLHRLPERAGGQAMPTVQIVDMRYEKPNFEGTFIFSSLLREKIAQRIDRKEQVILFLNRRGYAPCLQCSHCGHRIQCLHCHISLVYHRSTNSLRCHLCGYTLPLQVICPACKAPNIWLKGIGTQRIENCVRKLFPAARVLRLDTDSLNGKANRPKNWIQNFCRGEYDILIGTQMVAKGLDFPNVTLVGMIHADSHLNTNDFRAEERTFQLLVQVSGRSGRAEKSGEVIIQTFMPTAQCIQMACRHEMDVFLDDAWALRKQYGYPPFRHIVRHILKSRSQKTLEFCALNWEAHVKQGLLNTGVEMLGPTLAPQEKVNGFYRMHALFFMQSVTTDFPKLLALRDRFKMPHALLDLFDVDPVDFC